MAGLELRAAPAVLEELAALYRAALDRRFGRFAAELEWYAAALRDARVKGVRYRR